LLKKFTAARNLALFLLSSRAGSKKFFDAMMQEPAAIGAHPLNFSRITTSGEGERAHHGWIEQGFLEKVSSISFSFARI
jgi:hypothetical protein